jgi:hypothetical protein
MLCTDDDIRATPTLLGRHGRAWSIDPQRIWEKHGDTDAQVANWVIEAPYAHPVWHSYWLALIHLQPMPGVLEPTKIYVPGATHEFWLYALDPDRRRGDLIDQLGVPRVLTPINFAAQIVCASDDVARALILSAVMEVVEGRLSPDTDHRSVWAQRFGGAMLR